MKKITIEIDENTRGGRILEQGLDGLIEALLDLDQGSERMSFCRELELCEGEIMAGRAIPRWRCRKCIEAWLNSPGEVTGNE